MISVTGTRFNLMLGVFCFVYSVLSCLLKDNENTLIDMNLANNTNLTCFYKTMIYFVSCVCQCQQHTKPTN